MCILISKLVVQPFPGCVGGNHRDSLGGAAFGRQVSSACRARPEAHAPGRSVIAGRDRRSQCVASFRRVGPLCRGHPDFTGAGVCRTAKPTSARVARSNKAEWSRRRPYRSTACLKSLQSLAFG
jgi:hypothetical protein